MAENAVWRGGLLLGVAGVAWGGLFPVVKQVMGVFDPFTLTLLRYGVAAPVFVALLVLAEGRGSLRTEGHGWALWRAGTLGFAGFGLLAFLGLRHTRPEHAAVIPALMPLIAILVNWARGRARPGGGALFCVGLGMIGVALVVTHGDVGALLHGGAGGGELVVLAGATCWVLYTLGAAAVPGWSSLRYTALSCALGLSSIAAAWLAALALGMAHLPAASAVPGTLPALVYLTLFASVIAVLGWNYGIRAVGAAQGVLFINLVPIVAFAVALAEGRTARPAELLGVALVMTALVLNSLGGVRPAWVLRRA